MEKSNKFLKVTGILMIIGGSIALIFGIFILLFGVLLELGAIHNPGPGVNKVVGLVEAGVVLAVVGSVVQFIAGIVGVKNANKPEKANVCIVFGALTALIYIVSQVLDFIGGGIHNTYDVVSVIIGLLVPALYMVGAIQNKMKD